MSAHAKERRAPASWAAGTRPGQVADSTSLARPGDRFAPVFLGLVFALSGSAALIFQVCWQRLMSVHYGVGAISTAIVVSTFMLGLGIGGLLGGRIAERSAKAPLFYVFLEAGIGIFGIASLPLLSLVGRYTAGSSYVLTVVYVALFLLIPTVLMGMTLPAVIRILQERRDSIVLNLGFYYFLNTIGAGFGAIVCSYVLISLLGIDGAVMIAVAINFLLATSVWLWSRRPVSVVAVCAGTEPEVSDRRAPMIFPLLFLNGFIAIGYQVVWYRAVGVLLRDSVYSFSSILFIYLVGLGLGSLWIHRAEQSRWAGRRFDLYLLLNAAVSSGAIVLLLGAYALADSRILGPLLSFSQRFVMLPYLGELADPGTAQTLLATIGLTFLWPVLLVLVPAFFMGAAFPIGLSLLSGRRGHAISQIGLGYGVTIAGNTAGGLVTSFLLLPGLGTMRVVLAFAVFQVGSLMLIRAPRILAVDRRIFGGALALVAAVVIAVSPSSAVLYHRFHPPFVGYTSYFNEGIEGVAMVYERGAELTNFINGSNHGKRPGGGYVHEALVALSHVQAPKRVLVIGYGAGAMLAALQLDPRIESITVVEVNRTALENLLAIPVVKQGVADRRVTFIVDDGRRYLERNSQAFDLITIDPLQTRSAFSNNIYSQEFFELARKNLASDGVFLVWCGDDVTGGLKKTVATTFPNVRLYSYFMIASLAPTLPSRDLYDRLFQKLPEDVATDTRHSDKPLLGDRADILRATESVPVNRDRKPYLEYYILGGLFRPTVRELRLP